MAKAGVFAENAAGVVADKIAARLHGKDISSSYRGEGNCYLEFGGGKVARVDATFLGRPSPTARIEVPSESLAAEKAAFASTRRRAGSEPDPVLEAAFSRIVVPEFP